MALANYTDLQTAIQTWMARTNLNSHVPDFITLFEAFMNRKLRYRSMISSDTLTPDANGFCTLPDDFLEYRRVTLLSGDYDELDYITPRAFTLINPQRTSGVAKFFTIEGGSLKITPVDSTDVELLYYARIPALSGTTTNWVMTDHPDLYLFGSLCESLAMNKNVEQAVLWKARRDEIMTELNEEEKNTMAPSSQLIGISFNDGMASS